MKTAFSRIWLLPWLLLAGICTPKNRRRKGANQKTISKRSKNTNSTNKKVKQLTNKGIKTMQKDSKTQDTAEAEVGHQWRLHQAQLLLDWYRSQNNTGKKDKGQAAQKARRNKNKTKPPLEGRRMQ
jgi:hypothetical protein